MGILKLILIVAVVAGTAKGIQLFNRRCLRHFGHSFFTKRGFWLAAIAINLLWWGTYFWASAEVRHTPTMSDGLGLLALGLAATGWLIYQNVRDTDWLHGFGGSSLQLVLFFPLAVSSLPLMAAALVFLLVVSFKAGPIWLLDRR